jgi:DNA invertase Pin-like site-specific DNA recombinase
MDSQPTKVFCYVRVSGDPQLAPDRDAFPRQIAACREYANRHNLKIAGIYREEAVSGGEDMLNRPAWNALMDAVLKDGVRTILIEKLDRLSRLLLVQELAVDKLDKLGITLISTREREVMSKDATLTVLRQVMGVFAQYDRTQIVHKLRVARQRKREATGRCEGRKAFGYYDGEPEVLERIQRWYTEGVPLRQIAARLNAANVPPRKGKQWHHTSVRNILRRVASSR